MTTALPIDTQLASILRGDRPDARVLSSQADALYEAAVAHDVLPLLAERLLHGDAVPPASRGRFQAAAQACLVADLAAESELRRLLEALGTACVDVLLIKGAHLAYTHYPRPDLRARVDTDLLIAREREPAADRVLRELGYEAESKPSGEYTATQRSYALRRHDQILHMVDLHWRLASPQVFAHVLSFEETRAWAQPVAALGPFARVPSPVHALLIACMHRVAHHHDEADQFKWLLDLHLLAERFTTVEWEQFVRVAAERRVAAVCREGLERTVFWFRTPVPAGVLAELRLAAAGAPEHTAAYLRRETPARRLAADLRALPTWRARVQLLGEHLFPSRDYMRRTYAPESRLPVPVLYVVRIVRGAGAWFTPHA